MTGQQCSKCHETKALSDFQFRTDSGTYRKQCRRCRNGALKKKDCVTCGGKFFRSSDKFSSCSPCRKKEPLQCKHCGARFVRDFTHRLYCSAECGKEAKRLKDQANRRTLREELLEAYGRKCTCKNCPETNEAFLTLEHIGLTGKAHRQEVGSHAYLDLKRRGFPQEGFTLLCYNCNIMTKTGNECPHAWTT